MGNGKVFTIDKRTGIGRYVESTWVDKWKTDPSTGLITGGFTDGTFSNTVVATPQQEEDYQAARKNASFYTTNVDGSAGVAQNFAQAPSPGSPDALGLTAATSDLSNVSSLMESYADTQRKSQLAALDVSRQSSLSALGAEETAAIPQYAAQRSQARTQSQLSAKSFADFLAQRRLTKSGGAALGETNRLGALQGQIGGLQQDEQAQLGDINRRRTLAEQNYQTGLLGANANIDAQMYQNMINQSNADRTFNAQQTQYADSLAQTDLANKSVEEQNKINNFLSTIGQFGGNYKAEIDRISTNVANGDNSEAWKLPYLGAAREDKKSQLGLDDSGNPLPQTAQITSTAAMNLWQQLGTANESIAQALGIPVGTPYQGLTTGTGGGTGGGTDGGTDGGATNQAQIISGYEALKGEFIQDSYQGAGIGLTSGTLTPLQSIQKINNNYDAYVAKYTKQAVDQMILDLQSQMGQTSGGVTSTQVTVTPKMNNAILHINETYDPGTTWYRSAVISYLDGLHTDGDIELEEGKYILESLGLL